ncbi:MAG: hypothetical protein JNL28_15120 [Planctomycetes bacterium]|nr:hypothetical protein [Planctomycetota bacterium]
MNHHRRNILVFVALLVCARMALVLSLADAFGYGEEFAKSGAAKAMLDGLGLPHHVLNYAYHEGGGFLVSHLEALGFLLLGPCVLVVKLVAIAFAITTLVVGAWMVAEHVSVRAAYVFATFFVLAPETFQRVSLLSLGTHVEACVFILLAFHFTTRVVRGDGSPNRAAIWLGLVGGFGCYVGLQMPPVLLVCGIAVLATLRGKVLLGVVVRGLAGFVIGAIPLWWMMSKIGVGGVYIYRASGAEGRPGFFESLPQLVAPILNSRDPLTWAQTIGFVAVIAWGLALRRSRMQWILLGYLLVFAIGWGASGFVLKYDGTWFYLLRLVPPWLVVTILAAIGVDTLFARGGTARVLALIVCATAVLSGVVGFVRLAGEGRPASPRENFDILLHTRGYSHQEYILQVEWHFAGSAEDKARVFLRSKDDPALLVPEIANALYSVHSAYASDEIKNRTLDDVLPQLESVFGANHDLALLGLGMLVHGNWEFDFPAAYARIESLPEKLREPLAESLGRAGRGPAFRTDRLSRHLEVVPPERWHDAWWRGIGWRLHKTFRLRPDLARHAIASLPENARAPATLGWERARRLDWIE